MKDYFWTTLFLLAVLRSAVAFKIPGLSGGGNGNGRSPSGGNKPPAAGGSNGHKDGGEYMGPVFIIRELDKDNGEYDAFITTGGIQEVKPQSPPYAQQQQQQQQQQHAHQQMTYQMNPAGATPLPTLAKDEVEDSEYFGVLITPDTVRTLNYPKATHINVSLSVLLVAASSRMPWLLVLHRKNYPAFEYQQQQQQQQQPPVPTHAGHLPQQQSAAGIPGMQIPQRRRHYTPPLDRQRRGLNSQYGDAPQWSEKPQWENDDKAEYIIVNDNTKMRVMPMMFERQLMSTMCSNFERENADMDRSPVNEFYFDSNAYAAAAESGRLAKPENFMLPKYHMSQIKIQPNDMEADSMKTEEINQNYPKRVSPQTTKETYTDEELNRMSPKRDASQAVMWPTYTVTKEDGTDYFNQQYPKRFSSQTTKETYTDEELNRMFIKNPASRTTIRPTYMTAEQAEVDYYNQKYPKRVSSQTTKDTYTDEELNRMYTRNPMFQTTKKTYTDEELDRMFTKNHASQITTASEEPTITNEKTEAEEINQNNPKRVSSQTTEQTYTDEELNRMFVRHETMRPFTKEEMEQVGKIIIKTAESQPTTKPLTVEEAEAADKVYTI